MTKKKAAKKAKKAAKKKAGGAAVVEATAAETGSCSDRELAAAGVVTSAGELMAGLAEAFLTALEARGIDIRDLISTALANPQRSPEIARVGEEGTADEGLALARELLLLLDLDEKPYLRVYGRVMQILLSHREFQTCTAGDVFRVFLVEIPNELPEHYRQTPPRGQQVSVSTGEGRKTFNNRMKRMRRNGFAEPTVTRGSGRDEDYVLTERGQLLFDGWPPLHDIPGLELDGQITPESRSRQRS